MVKFKEYGELLYGKRFHYLYIEMDCLQELVMSSNSVWVEVWCLRENEIGFCYGQRDQC